MLFPSRESANNLAVAVAEVRRKVINRRGKINNSCLTLSSEENCRIGGLESGSGAENSEPKHINTEICSGYMPVPSQTIPT